MTSFIVDAHTRRTTPPSWKSDDSCVFCRIIQHTAPAYRVYEDDALVAFLDILPLRPGHVLLVPKVHYARVSELPAQYAAALGAAISKISHALTKGTFRFLSSPGAMENTALNVVCNQEYAQAVPHVHYHIIPAPDFSSRKAASLSTTTNARKSPTSVAEMHHKEFEARGELDDDEAIDLVKKVKAHL
ncbi:HIT-like protein [Amylostereum chailletii]|nr:HIT-like protein [Amylostereum chailletii]